MFEESLVCVSVGVGTMVQAQGAGDSHGVGGGTLSILSPLGATDTQSRGHRPDPQPYEP